ncbi:MULTISPECIES: hypothetical protein [Pseudomonas putida group]|uniref:Uncharacterized protein n=1 Tax=Pseudomonas monteilii SB3101 TaxID=1435058 RepID=V9V673_9PSED|nr:MULTISPECIES: hypothetical protein [Pseudomonas putida group]AHC85676.1 hypothetical protein X969_07435 [Pseudomonas monteilii SB3078]AHC91044.1 hypothetical protein X970_07410 [Pseudomonas monteilii SB3101]KGK24934.1 hypothetical protein GT93_08805 [Pseudomonas plecoglossicida]
MHSSQTLLKRITDTLENYLEQTAGGFLSALHNIDNQTTEKAVEDNRGKLTLLNQPEKGDLNFRNPNRQTARLENKHSNSPTPINLATKPLRQQINSFHATQQLGERMRHIK